MNIYDVCEKFVQLQNINKFGKKSKHAERTVFWLLKIYPKADDAIKIAAIAHDIERAFRDNEIENIINNKKGFLDEKHMKYHQDKSAEIIGEFLSKINADKKLIDRVKGLVSKHEIGGTHEQDMLKDADSISFFENNTDHFISDLANKVGKKKIKEKFEWMFERIGSGKTKKIVRVWYDEGMKKFKN